jgi:hypothetical protein
MRLFSQRFCPPLGPPPGFIIVIIPSGAMAEINHLMVGDMLIGF